MNELFSNQPPDDAGGDGELDPGVLGQLPKSRPARRSPRRKTAPVEAQAPTPRRAPSARAAAASSPPPEPDRGVIEEVARTGVSVALGAAEAGFAIAGKALGALRRR